MTETANGMTVERFTDLLDIHGGDLERWPSHLSGSAAALLAASAEARSRLAEARALDRLLDRAAAEPDRGSLNALADRIVAAAIAEGASPVRHDRSAAGAATRQGAEVIRLPARAPRPGPESVRPSGAVSQASRGIRWRPAAALAASLLLGIAIGLTDVVDSNALGLASLTGTTTTDVEAVISAVQLDSLHVLDEDQI